MTDTGQTPPGQRIYGTAAPTPGGYHPAGPTTVSFNGIGDPQGPGAYRQPGPVPDFQPGHYYSASGNQRPIAAVYPKSTGFVGRTGWGPVRYGGAPQTPVLNQMLQGASPDGWIPPEYGQTLRPMVDAGSQPGWSQQQHLASPTASSSYSNRQQPAPQQIQVSPLFTALHGMQTRSYDEISVRPSVRLSVCLSVKRVHCDKTEESYV